MRQFIIEIIVFTLITMFCLSVFGQDWQDEEHVWNEEKGRFEIHNKAHGRIVNDVKQEDKNENGKFEPPSEEWVRYLPRSVRNGSRAPKDWEIREAQRKLWAKEIITVRAMEKADQRRQLMAWRRATGWHYKRSANAYAPNSIMRYHMYTSGYRY